jgi:glycine/D-amino acid oxidase-like deaminating enzyme
MAHIIIIGAGIGGLPMAFEMRQMARPEDSVTVLANSKTFHFPHCSGRPGTGSSHDLECHLSGRLRFHRRGLRRLAADSAAQCELVLAWSLGTCREDRPRKVLHAQAEVGNIRADLRKVRDEGARHYETQGKT